MPDSQSALKSRASEIAWRLKSEYPQVRTALNFSNPLELLIATILSAQCTDERVNQVTLRLFNKYRVAQDYAKADLAELEEDIRSTGFYHNKARNIKACCRTLVEKHGGQVPKSQEDMVKLEGVGRKTANVVLGSAYGIPGITVDTHVKRLAQRLGLTSHSDPVKIEFDLMGLIPQEEWSDFSLRLIAHGRRVCVARKPKHLQCCLADICPSANI